MRFSKLARVLAGEITEEIVKVLLRNRQPDLYYSFEKRMVEAMEAAYQEGLKAGRNEILTAVELFDEKDKVGN